MADYSSIYCNSNAIHASLMTNKSNTGGPFLTQVKQSAF